MAKEYVYQEFPRMVYGPDGDRVKINSEDECPEGYLSSPNDFTGNARKDAAKAEKAAKLAAENERTELRKYLDDHGVKYSPNLGTEKLRALSDQLTEHLEKQAGANGDSE